MVGPELDRLAQMKKDGVMSVQLTYNNRNLAGDGALEPANAGLSKLGRATIERIEEEKLLLDLSPRRSQDDGRGRGLAKRPLVSSHTGARALSTIPATPTTRPSGRSPTRAGWSASISCPS